MRWSRGLSIVLLLSAFAPRPSHAAEPTAAEKKAETASPAERAAAGEKFKDAEASFKRADFSRAALAFEASYGIVPHPSTLLNAAEAWEKGRETRDAAKALMRLQADFPSSSDASVAGERLKPLLQRLAVLRVTVESGGEALAIDAAPADVGPSVVEPGEHVITARFGDELVEREVTVGAGADISLLISPTADREKGGAASEGQAPWPTPLPIYVFSASAALTVASSALLVWSGVETLSAREAFDADPTQARLDDGLAIQTRTNVLVGLTAGLAAVTAALGVFTRWDDLSPRPSLGLSTDAGFVSFEASF